MNADKPNKNNIREFPKSQCWKDIHFIFAMFILILRINQNIQFKHGESFYDLHIAEYKNVFIYIRKSMEYIPEKHNENLTYVYTKYSKPNVTSLD